MDIEALIKRQSEINMNIENDLGLSYLENGSDCDEEKAFHHLLKAAEGGSNDARCSLGAYYEEKKEDLEEAIQYYKKAAEQGHWNAQSNLARVYYENKEYEEAFYWYEIIAKRSSAFVQNDLGLRYLEQERFHKAVEWFFQSAKQGYANAQCSLGACYLTGFDDEEMPIPKDEELAVFWLKKAAQQGYANALYNLGACRPTGFDDEEIPIPKDENLEVLGSHEKKLEAEEQYKQGMEYFYKDESKAFECFKNAAELGYPEAQYQLGRCYEKKTAGNQSYNEAFKWFEKAANQGAKEHLEEFTSYCKFYIGSDGDCENGDETEQLKKTAKEQLNQICKKLYSEAEKDLALHKEGKESAKNYFDKAHNIAKKKDTKEKNGKIIRYTAKKHYEVIYNYVRADILGNEDAKKELKKHYFFELPK
ncbi:MAG: tetratricopeptide repeat protein [Bacillota bacterium]